MLDEGFVLVGRGCYLKESEADEFAGCANVIVTSGEDGEEESCEEEALHLYPSPAELFDGVDGDEVASYIIQSQRLHSRYQRFQKLAPW